MIIAQKKIRVPGKLYRTKISCVSTRRPTTVEWLVLSTIGKFSKSNMRYEKLKYVFEEIFQFQNSELLLRPCLQTLTETRLIKNPQKISYSDLKFADVALTEQGQYMLINKLLPGEHKELALDIYYNPLTRGISNQPNSEIDLKNRDIIDFGSESDYSNELPTDYVRQSLQKGEIASGKFTASKLQIQKIDLSTSSDWETAIHLLIELSSDGKLTTDPVIYESHLKNRLNELIIPKDISSVMMEGFPKRKDVRMKSIIGSGEYIKNSILNVCKNGKLIAIDAQFYKLYKNNTTAFEDKVVLIFGAGTKVTIEENFSRGKIWTNVYIPIPFNITGCVAINNRQAHVELCSNICTYDDEITITIPLAYEAFLENRDECTIENWLKSYALELVKEDIYGAVLMSLCYKIPDEFYELLYTRWSELDAETIIKDLKILKENCSLIKRKIPNIDFIMSMLIEKLDFSVEWKALEEVRNLYDMHFLNNSDEHHLEYIKAILAKLQPPAAYSDLLNILRSFQIESSRDMELLGSPFSDLYSVNIIKELLISSFDEKYVSLIELTHWEEITNSLFAYRKDIENLLGSLKLANEYKADVLASALYSCQDVEKLKFAADNLLHTINKVQDYGFNLYEVLEEKNRKLSENITLNLTDVISKLDEIDVTASFAGKPVPQNKKSEIAEDSKLLPIDLLSIRELKKYSGDVTDPLCTYMISQQIKTIGDFRKMTSSSVDTLSAKGKQTIYKNTIKRLIENKDSIIQKIKII